MSYQEDTLAAEIQNARMPKDWHMVGEGEWYNIPPPKPEFRYPWGVDPSVRYPEKEPAKYTELEKTYPPDKFGDEAKPNARVWRLYQDRVNELDSDQLDGWQKTLDILLIFAGLFSAVTTAFLIESYKNLQPDYTEVLALAFLAFANRTDTTRSPPQLPDPAAFSASSTTRCINGLWFGSLVITLLVAFLAILAKQWLGEYVSRMRAHIGSRREWAWRHRVFRRGLDKWHMESFITALPLLLYLALFTFFVGLVLFLADLDRAISVLVLALMGIAGLFYLVATVVPLWWGDCPSATPLLRQGRTALEVLYIASHRLFSQTWHMAVLVLCTLSRSECAETAPPKPARKGWSAPAYTIDLLMTHSFARRDSEVLKWMIESLPVADEAHIALDAMGSLDVLEHADMYTDVIDPNARARPAHKILARPASVILLDRLSSLLNAGGGVDSRPAANSLRTALFLGLERTATFKSVLAHPAIAKWRSRDDHDLRPLRDALIWSAPFEPELQGQLHSPLFGPQQNDRGDRAWVNISLPFLPSALALALRNSVRGDYNIRTLDLEHTTASLIRYIPFLTSANAWASSRTACVLIVTFLQKHLGLHPRRSLATESEPEKAVFYMLDVLGWLAVNQPWKTKSIRGPIVEESVLCTYRDMFMTIDREGVRIMPADAEHALRMVTYEPFLKRFGAADFMKAVDSLFKRTDWRAGWSTDLGVILSSLIQHAAAPGGGGFTAVTTILVPVVADSGCDYISRQLEASADADEAIIGSRLNFLKGSAESVWLTMWLMMGQSTLVCLNSLARDIAASMCQLHRSGTDVQDYISLLFGPNYALRFLLSDPANMFYVAHHIKEISLSWWTAFEAEVRALSAAEWASTRPGLHGFSTPAEWADRVVAAEPCSKCPQRLNFHRPAVEMQSQAHRQRTIKGLPRRILEHTRRVLRPGRAIGAPNDVEMAEVTIPTT